MSDKTLWELCLHFFEEHLPPQQFNSWIKPLICEENGSVVTLTGQTFDASELLAAIDRHRPQSMAIVGDSFAKPILNALNAAPERYDVSSIAAIVSSGVMWSLEVKRGLLEQTLIVFTSDHGDMLGDQNLWRKSYAYQASSRIPMAMRWPAGMISAKRGITMDQPVEIRDLLPTFLDAAQAAEPPKPLDGKSLLSLVRNNGQGWREYIDLEHDVCYSRENHWNALTDGRWKYIYHARDGEEQLFDLVNDPHELKTSSDETQLRKWRGRLTSHFEERGEPFLKNGRLAPRPESMLHSPHFPGK